jgi:Oxidoreductase family, NAD-binding Rossmann fold
MVRRSDASDPLRQNEKTQNEKTMSGICLVLIGGGRWGRTHAGVLSQFSGRIARVLWVTRHNRRSLDGFLAKTPSAAPTLELFSNLNAALAEKPDAAIVVTAASDHASTVETLLRNDVPTLVEKPLALSMAAATSLVELAERRKVLLCVALHLLKADFLQHFRQLWVGRRLTKIDLEWLDPDSEVRHGEVKSSNLTTNKADEVVSHLWSVLRMMQDADEPRLREIKLRSLGAVELELDVGASPATVLFGRRASARRRSIKLRFHDGGSAELDFTIEPGRIAIDGEECANIDPGNRVGPLAAEIEQFLDIVEGRQDMASSPQLAARCLGSVTLAETVRERLIASEAKAVAARLRKGRSIRDPDVSAWIVDNVAPLLGAEGMRFESTDENGVGQILEAFRQAVHEEVSCVPAPPRTRASRSISSIVRACRFFALVTKQLSDHR